MKFRKKPVVIEAKQLLPGDDSAIIHWCHEGLRPESNSIALKDIGGLRIRTLEGWLYAPYGSWIVKGIVGEFYPVRPDIFEKTYEPVPKADLGGRE